MQIYPGLHFLLESGVKTNDFNEVYSLRIIILQDIPSF